MLVTLSVTLSGTAFTFLLYENLKNTYFQEGFLIGDFSEKETKTITDNDQQQVHLHRVIRIRSAIPCPQPFFFYDGFGRIDPDRIKNYLGDLAPKVVAWYKYKSSSGINLTFREKLIHRQLADMFHLPSEFFSTCLLISESSDNNSTHSFTQTFMRYHNNGFEQLPMRIVNLSHTNVPYKSPEQESDTFCGLLKTVQIDVKLDSNPPITRIQNALEKRTEEIVEELADAEKELFQLENEIERLRESVKEKELNNVSNCKEVEINDFIMDAELEVSSVGGSMKIRGRGKTNAPTKPKRSSLRKTIRH